MENQRSCFQTKRTGSVKRAIILISISQSFFNHLQLANLGAHSQPSRFATWLIPSSWEKPGCHVTVERQAFGQATRFKLHRPALALLW